MTTLKSIIDQPELIRRFNEDEAVWRCYQQKRRLRRILQCYLPKSSRRSAKTLDLLDWQTAERECRSARAIGIPL